jgi:hypothetical protein
VATVWCGVVWCGVVWCGVVWCGVVWCGVVWCVCVCVCVSCVLCVAGVCDVNSQSWLVFSHQAGYWISASVITAGMVRHWRLARYAASFPAQELLLSATRQEDSLNNNGVRSGVVSATML